MNNWMRVSGMVAPLMALVLLAACGGTSAGDDGRGVTREIDVALTKAGCEPARIEIAAGTTTFHVTNQGASAVTEFEVLDGDSIVGEVEHVIEGLHGDLTVELHEGEYQTLCPGGTSNERGTLIVTPGDA